MGHLNVVFNRILGVLLSGIVFSAQVSLAQSRFVGGEGKAEVPQNQRPPSAEERLKLLRLFVSTTTKSSRAKNLSIGNWLSEMRFVMRSEDYAVIRSYAEAHQALDLPLPRAEANSGEVRIRLLNLRLKHQPSEGGEHGLLINGQLAFKGTSIDPGGLAEIEKQVFSAIGSSKSARHGSRQPWMGVAWLGAARVALNSFSASESEAFVPLVAAPAVVGTVMSGGLLAFMLWLETGHQNYAACLDRQISGQYAINCQMTSFADPDKLITQSLEPELGYRDVSLRCENDRAVGLSFAQNPMPQSLIRYRGNSSISNFRFVRDQENGGVLTRFVVNTQARYGSENRSINCSYEVSAGKVVNTREADSEICESARRIARSADTFLNESASPEVGRMIPGGGAPALPVELLDKCCASTNCSRKFPSRPEPAAGSSGSRDSSRGAPVGR